MKTSTALLGGLLLLAPVAAVGQVADATATLSAEDWRALALELLAPATIINPTEVSVASARAGVRPRDADAWHQLGESPDVAGRLRKRPRLPAGSLGPGSFGGCGICHGWAGRSTGSSMFGSISTAYRRPLPHVMLLLASAGGGRGSETKRRRGPRPPLPRPV